MTDLQPGGESGGSAARIRAIYAARGAQVPPAIEARIGLAELSGRMDALEAVENVKRALVAETALDPKTEQLIQFAQLLVLGHASIAEHHARFARREGASLAELSSVAEHAVIAAGLPAYLQGMDILARIAQEAAG
jgi:4-carboxymuconolactone decarboxylase